MSYRSPDECPILKRLYRFIDPQLNLFEDSCWNFTGSRDKDGYGKFKLEGKTIAAHRISYMYHHGLTEIPKGLYVCHTCDNPSCINPDHLWLGTNKENQQDCIRKGRKKIADQSGPNNGNAKLTQEDLDDIFLRYDQGDKVLDIARQYGVSDKTIYYNLKKRS